MIIIRPEMESMKLCTASEVIAREPERIPTMILIIPSKKFTAIKRYPEQTMT